MLDLQIWALKIKKFLLNPYLWGSMGSVLLLVALVLVLFKKEATYDMDSFTSEFLSKDDHYFLVSPENYASRRVNFLVYHPEKFSWLKSTYLEMDIGDLEKNLKILRTHNLSFQRERSLFDEFTYRPLAGLTVISLLLFGVMLVLSFRHSLKTKPAKKLRTVHYTNDKGNEASKLEEVSEETETLVKFTDVAGIDEVKLQVQEVVDLIKDSSKIMEMGGKVPKGIILHGPPGTGKTMLARATANECHASFLAASGSEFLEVYVGMGAKRIRELFNRAKGMSPCIIFIDEIDAVGGKRGVDNNSEREQALNQLLTEMDGFNGNENVFIFAATNQLDKLDAALLRPGRFDRQIYVPLPDVGGRVQILKVYLDKSKTDDSINPDMIARVTSGFSGAELSNLINEAIIYAARQGKETISQSDILWAKDKIIMGMPRNMFVSLEDKTHTAYHEIGHAFICHHLKVDRLVNISIMPRGQALGQTQIESEDVLSIHKQGAVHQLAMLLGGRVAEKIFFKNHLSTGASNDLQRVYSLTHAMITKWGMSEVLGPVSLDGVHFTSLSEQTNFLVDKEIRDLIVSAETLASDVLKNHQNLVEFLSKKLLEKENLSVEEFNQLITEFKHSHE